MIAHEQQVSARGINFIRAWAPCVLDPWRDDADQWRCGFGHRLSADEPRERWTEDAARVAFTRDVTAAAAEVSFIVLDTMLMQHEFDALTSIVFDLGQCAMRRSRMGMLISTGRFIEAGLEFPRISLRVIVGKSVDLHRRFAEQAIFMHGDYSYVPPVARKDDDLPACCTDPDNDDRTG